ncbi:MAG: AMP-binding protein [Actinomycetota bacterium]|nr:AMP-binding protein [Actinomycetota bacterium]
MPKTIATTPSWYWPEGVPRVLGVPPRSVVQLGVDRPAQHDPGRPAVVWGEQTLTAAELAACVAALGADIENSAATPGAVVVCAGASLAGVVAVLGALASGRPSLLVAPGERGSDVVLHDQVLAVAVGDAEGLGALGDVGVPALEVGGQPADGTDEQCLAGTDVPGDGSVSWRSGDELGAPSVRLAGRSGPVWHSQRSLLAGALALRAFVSPSAGSSWLTLASPCTWDGLCGVVTALVSGVTLLAARPGDEGRDVYERHGPQWTVSSLALAADSWSGSGRRRGRAAERWILAGVDGPFDPDERRAVAAAAGADVLTMFGLAETGPMLASHPSWYLDESVGIPVPNMHVVPADPDTGEPVDAMWELLDRAMVSVWGPSLAVGGVEPGPGEPLGRRFATGVLAASDPNGMLYLVDE